MEKKACNYGCSLLKELAFKFLTYAQDEVSDKKLRYLLLSEYATIIKQQIESVYLYKQICTRSEAGNNHSAEDLFNAFFKAKQKKMNFEMMLLADCVTRFSGGSEADQTVV